MLESVFNSLPVVAPSAEALPPSAWGLTIGDNFLFTRDAHQQPVSLTPDANRVTYCRRIAQDKTGGPYPIGGNYTQTIQPVSAGGPFPSAAIPYTDISFPAEGVLKGQGTKGYVRVYDIIE